MTKIPKLGRVKARENGTDGRAYVRVEWIDDEGYRVVGEFMLIDWPSRHARRANGPWRSSVIRLATCTVGGVQDVAN
jgi:hypothetical protein